LGDSLLLFCVVVLIESIDIFLCLLDRLGSLGCELFTSFGDGSIPLLSPLPDDLWLFFLLGVCPKPRVVVYRRARDRATGTDSLGIGGLENWSRAKYYRQEYTYLVGRREFRELIFEGTSSRCTVAQKIISNIF
jgi:hypothetical protein